MSVAAPRRRAPLYSLALGLLVLAALLLPRLLALRGALQVPLRFYDDLPEHLCNLDLIDRLARLQPEAAADPFVHEHPELATPCHPMRWPPVPYLVARPVAAALGPLSLWTTQVPNFLFFLVLLAGLAALGRAMGDLRLGLWAALLAALCPPLVGSSFYFSPELPLCAMCMVGLFLLWRCRGFTRRLPTFDFGVWSGLGLCTKASYGLFMLVPALLALGLGLKRGPRRGLPLNLLLGLSAAVLVVALLVPIEWRDLGREVTDHLFSSDLPAGRIDLLSLEWLLFVPGYVALMLPFPLLPLVLPGLLALAWRRDPARLLVLAFIVGLTLVSTLMTNKLERYLLPLYPALCLSAVLWVRVWVPRRIQGLVLGAEALAFAVVLGLVYLFPTPWTLRGAFPENEKYPLVELQFPSRGLLQGLRGRRGAGSPCELADLAVEAAQMARDVKGYRPLGVALDEPSLASEPPPFNLQQVTLQVMGSVRDRLVFLSLLGPGKELKLGILCPGIWTGSHQPPPLLLLVGDAANETRSLLDPGYRLTSRRELRLRCGEGERRMSLRLFTKP